MYTLIMYTAFDTTVIKITTKETEQDCTLNKKNRVSSCAHESCKCSCMLEIIIIQVILIGAKVDIKG